MNERQAWEEIVQEWKQLDKLEDLNQRLYDELGGAIMYILEYSKRNNIVLPHRDRLFKMVENYHVTCLSIMDFHKKIKSLPRENQHDFKHSDNSTEPKYLSNI